MISKLILIPHSTKAATPMRAEFDLSGHVKQFLPSLSGIFAESMAGGRSWLKSMQWTLPIVVYNQDVPDRQVLADLQAAKGQTWAFVSDAGYPCIADPGARLVELARQEGFSVHLMPGTSSIFSAIALSGLPAQRFAFHGYLPRESHALQGALRSLEQASAEVDGSWQGASLQVFIETPYRHRTLMQHCLESLDDSTWLCVASEVGNEGECIRTYTIGTWKKHFKDLNEPELVAVYLLLASKKRLHSAQKHARYGEEKRLKGKFKTQESICKRQRL